MNACRCPKAAFGIVALEPELIISLATHCVTTIPGSRPTPFVETLSNDDDDDESIEAFNDEISVDVPEDEEDDVDNDQEQDGGGEQGLEEDKPVAARARKKPTKYKKNPNAPKRFRR